MEEPVETPYAMWLTDFLGEDIEPNVTAETDFSTATINDARIGTFTIGGIRGSGDLRPGMIADSTITCGTISSVNSLFGVGLTLKTELEKARARIAELEAELSTAQQRIAALEAKPVDVVGDPDWDMPRSLLPRGI